MTFADLLKGIKKKLPSVVKFVASNVGITPQFQFPKIQTKLIIQSQKYFL